MRVESLLCVRVSGARVRGDGGEIGDSLGEGLMDISSARRELGRVRGCRRW